MMCPPSMRCEVGNARACVCDGEEICHGAIL